MKTTEIPAIVDEAKKAGCENDTQIHGYLAAEISRLRGFLYSERDANMKLQKGTAIGEFEAFMVSQERRIREVLA
jgi:hypothetical protein